MNDQVLDKPVTLGSWHTANLGNGAYVLVDEFGHRVFRISSIDGEVEELSCPDGFRYPTGAAVSGDSIFICDSWHHCIVVFNRAGQFQHTLGQYGSESDCFNGPSDIAIDAEGHLWVADTGNDRLQIMTPEGQVIDTKKGRHLHPNDAVNLSERLGQRPWSPPGIGFFPLRVRVLDHYFLVQSTLQICLYRDRHLISALNLEIPLQPVAVRKTGVVLFHPDSRRLYWWSFGANQLQELDVPTRDMDYLVDEMTHLALVLADGSTRRFQLEDRPESLVAQSRDVLSIGYPEIPGINALQIYEDLQKGPSATQLEILKQCTSLTKDFALQWTRLREQIIDNERPLRRNFPDALSHLFSLKKPLPFRVTQAEAKALQHQVAKIQQELTALAALMVRFASQDIVALDHKEQREQALMDFGNEIAQIGIHTLLFKFQQADCLKAQLFQLEPNTKHQSTNIDLACFYADQMLYVVGNILNCMGNSGRFSMNTWWPSAFVTQDGDVDSDTIQTQLVHYLAHHLPDAVKLQKISNPEEMKRAYKEHLRLLMRRFDAADDVAGQLDKKDYHPSLFHVLQKERFACVRDSVIRLSDTILDGPFRYHVFLSLCFHLGFDDLAEEEINTRSCMPEAWTSFEKAAGYYRALRLEVNRFDDFSITTKKDPLVLQHLALNFAIALARQGQETRAKSWLTKALQTLSRSQEFLSSYFQGIFAFNSRNFALAAATLNRLSPPLANDWIIISLLALQEHDAALKLLEDEPCPLKDLLRFPLSGFAWLLKGNPEKAKASFERTGSSFFGAHFYLGIWHRQQGDLEQALHHFTEEDIVFPSWSNRLQMALTYQNMQQFQRAEQCLAQFSHIPMIPFQSQWHSPKDPCFQDAMKHIQDVEMGIGQSGSTTLSPRVMGSYLATIFAPAVDAYYHLGQDRT